MFCGCGQSPTGIYNSSHWMALDGQGQLQITLHLMKVGGCGKKKGTMACLLAVTKIEVEMIVSNPDGVR